MKSRMSGRVFVVAALGLALASSLAACRVEPGAAVFVGDVRITDTDVDEIVDEAIETLTADAPEQARDFPVGDVRDLAVDALTVVELGTQVAKDTGAEPDPDAGQHLQEHMLHSVLPEDSRFAALQVEAAGYRAMLLESAEPVTPEPEEAEAMAEQIIAASGADPDPAHIEQLSGVLIHEEHGQLAVGQHRLLADYVDEYDVTVNPRYGSNFIVVEFDGDGWPFITVPVPR